MIYLRRQGVRQRCKQMDKRTSEYVLLPNPYSPGYSHMSSANRDPDTPTRVGGPSTGIRVHKQFVYRRHWSSSTHLRDVFTSCKLRHQKLRSLDFLLTEVVTKMRQQQRRVRCLNTKDQCNTAKKAGESNAPTRGAVTKQIGLLLTYFQLIAMIRNCQKCFIPHSPWRLIRVLAAFLN